MSTLIEWVNNLMSKTFLQNSVAEFSFALLVFLAIYLALGILKRFLMHYLGKLAKKTVSDFDDFLNGIIGQIGRPVFMVIALFFASSGLVLTKTLHQIIHYLVVFVVTIRVILIVIAVLRYSIEKILMKRMGADHPSLKAMTNSITSIIKWIIWAVGAIFILSNLGINVSSLLAGIGIGGIAVAMASQALLGDAFSAVSIYLDRPFEIGDFIIVGESMGTVEHVGIKTTRIRSLSGEQLVFVNSDLTSSRVRNYKRMQTRRIVFKIGIIYQTPVNVVEKIPVMIKEVLAKAGVRTERVHFLSFGDFALIYEIAYHVLSSDYGIYMDKQQEINLGIMKEFAENKIEFAYPTQMVYVNKT